MRTALALLVTPLVALGCITLAYALADPACTRGLAWVIYAVFAASLAFGAGTTFLAWRQVARRSRQEFLPLVAAWTGGFFSLVIASLLLAQLLTPPCAH